MCSKKKIVSVLALLASSSSCRQNFSKEAGFCTEIFSENGTTIIKKHLKVFLSFFYTARALARMNLSLACSLCSVISPSVDNRSEWPVGTRPTREGRKEQALPRARADLMARDATDASMSGNRHLNTCFWPDQMGRRTLSGV